MAIKKNEAIKFNHKHLLGIQYLSIPEVNLILDEAQTFIKLNQSKNKKINTKNSHGTGCTLSSAITTFLSCGKPIKKACELGIKYVNSAIKTNPKYGKGHGPINHLCSMKLDKRFK